MKTIVVAFLLSASIASAQPFSPTDSCTVVAAHFLDRIAELGDELKETRAERSSHCNKGEVTAIVQYKLPPHIDAAACAEHYEKIAPSFQTIPGLIRKQFIVGDDGVAGGVYLWRSRTDAEAFYSGPWLEGIKKRYETDPVIRYFDTICVTEAGSAK
jgi:hypothetical protein